MSDYDLDYICPILPIALVVGLFLSIAVNGILGNFGEDSVPSMLIVAGITILITSILALCMGSFIDNPKKQALKLSGITLGIVFGILSIIFFFIDYKLNWLFLILTIAIGEIIYWLDNKKPKKQDNKILFTARRKSLAMLYSGVILVVIVGGYSLIIRIEKFLINYDYIILKWLGYIGVGLVGLGIALSVIYMYFWLNNLKYRK